MTRELSIHTFSEQCVLGSRLQLDDRDVLGAKTGGEYHHRDYLRGYVLKSMGWLPSIRGGDVCATRGADAWRLAFILLSCPYLIDLRSYVPVFFSEASRRKRKPDLLLQWVLTLELKTRLGFPHLHVISTRPVSEAGLSKLHLLGITTEVLQYSEFPRQLRVNAMWSYARLLGYHIGWFDARAKLLGLYFDRSVAKGTLRRRLGLASSWLDIPNFERDKYRIFAAAIVLGYIRVDDRFPLDIDQELHLL